MVIYTMRCMVIGDFVDVFGAVNLPINTPIICNQFAVDLARSGQLFGLI